MADVQFDISLKNTGSGTEGLTLFAPVMATSQKANKYAFSTPYAATYPAGTVFTILDNNGSFIVTLNSEMTMAQVILLLNALNIGTFILAYNDSTNGNVFHLLSIRNPQTFSIDNNDYLGTFTLIGTDTFNNPPLGQICFIDANRVVIGTNHNAILLSTDAGLTFNSINLPGAPLTLYIGQIQFINSTTGFCIGYLSTDASYIYKTTNAGDSWTLIASHADMEFTAIWMFDDNNGLIYGMDVVPSFEHKVYSTSNGGVNITEVQTIGDQSGIFQFVNALTGFIFLSHAMANLILRTTDGGATWLSTNVGQTNGGFALDANNVWVVGNSGSVQYSSDGGVTFNPRNVATSNKLYTLYAFSTQKLFVGRQGRQWVYSNDGGLTWQNTLIAVGGSATILSFYNQYYGIAHDSQTNIYRYS